MKKIILALGLFLIPSLALAQTSFTFKDASTNPQTVKSFSCGGIICSLVVPADTTGAAFGVTGNPIFITGASGTFPVTGTLTAVTTVSTVTNLSQFGGAAINLGAGAVSTGTLRITQASDSPLVTVSGAIGDAASTAGGTGSLSAKLRLMTTQLDNINTNLQASVPAGPNLIGIVGIDQTTAGTTNAISVKYLNATAIDVNSGNLSAGTQRIALATNSLGLAHWGHITTGSAPPDSVQYTGALTSGAAGGLVQGLIQCDSKATYDASTSGSTELIALTSGRTVYLCGYTILSGGTVNVKLITGTGTACATGSANLTPAFQLTAQVGAVDGSQFYRGLKGASAGAVCINASAGVAVQAIIYYAVI